MAKSMRNHDMKSFWKDVSSTYSRRNVPLATTVNGASDPTAICDMWKPPTELCNVAEHYIHPDSRLAVLLSKFYTSALTHGHVPDAFMQSILVPAIKKQIWGLM